MEELDSIKESILQDKTPGDSQEIMPFSSRSARYISAGGISTDFKSLSFSKASAKLMIFPDVRPMTSSSDNV